VPHSIFTNYLLISISYLQIATATYIARLARMQSCQPPLIALLQLFLQLCHITGITRRSTVRVGVTGAEKTRSRPERNGGGDIKEKAQSSYIGMKKDAGVSFLASVADDGRPHAYPAHVTERSVGERLQKLSL
jgi:hypothetical protein